MNVEVNLGDGVFTSYDFDPMHKSEVIGFYTKLYWQGKIKSFKATMNDGSIVGIGY